MDKPVMKPRFKSEFSMGQLDFERYHRLLTAMDWYAVECRRFNQDAVVRLYSVLKQIYYNFRSIIFETKRKELEKKFKIIEGEIIQRGMAGFKFTFSMKIFRLLEEIMADLLEIKQIIGLGIEVRPEVSKKQRWERALRIGDE